MDVPSILGGTLEDECAVTTFSSHMIDQQELT